MYLRQKVNLKLSCYPLYKYIVFIYTIFFHFDKRQIRKKFGQKNEEITFYVIRPNGDKEGLLSCYQTVVKKMDYAFKHGYVPVVDYKNYKNQYTSISDEKNSWELFFEQIANYTLEEVYLSKNVILSGWTIQSLLRKHESHSLFEDIELYKKCTKKIYINKDILIETEKRELQYINDKTLGVFIRGTDYVSLKPKGHYIQPTLEELLEKIEEFVTEFQISTIFLVTEDLRIEKKIKKECNCNVKTLLNSNAIDYDGETYLSEYISNDIKYKNTINYLMKMLLLRECPYIISSITNATFFLLSNKSGEFKDSYFFDKGYYK